MSDYQSAQSAPQPQSQAVPQPAPPRRGRLRRALFVVTLVVVAGFTGAIASQAMNGGFGPGYWHGRGFMGPMDQGFLEDRADRMARHLAVEVDASPEQTEKLRAVVKAAVRDLLPIREKAWLARREARVLLTQPTIDRTAIEKFRAEQAAQFDAASKRVAQALADLAETLTPDQRRKVGEFLDHIQRRHQWRHG